MPKYNRQTPRLNFETFLCYIIIQFCNLMPTNSKIQNDEMKKNIPNVHISKGTLQLESADLSPIKKEANMILVIILFSLVHYGSMYSSIKCMEGRYKKEKNHTCHFDANRKPYCELFIHEADSRKDHNHKGCGKFEPHFIPYDYCRSKTLISIVSYISFFLLHISTYV